MKLKKTITDRSRFLVTYSVIDKHGEMIIATGIDGQLSQAEKTAEMQVKERGFSHLL